MPTFFRHGEWVPQPSDWRGRTQSSAKCDLARAAPLPRPTAALPAGAERSPRYGAAHPVTPRLGQGTFRIAVLEAYGRACAVTGERPLPALEAAHIRRFADDGPHEVRNGLLLRADLHRLFDHGCVTVAPDLRLNVGSRLREDFANGRCYYPLHGAAVRAPSGGTDRPDSELLRWHNEHVFLG